MAQVCFTTSNYNFTTWPTLEWAFVVCPSADLGVYPHTPTDMKLWVDGGEAWERRHRPAGAGDGLRWKGAHGRKVWPLEEVLTDPAVQRQVELLWTRRRHCLYRSL